MSQSHPRGRNRTFSTSLTVLGGVGVAQLLAVAWALATQSGDPVPLVPIGDLGLPQLTEEPPVQEQVGSGAGAEIPEYVGEPSYGNPSGSGVGEMMVPMGPVLLLPPERRITSPVALEAIADGVALRNEGDTQGSIGRLREAEVVLPGHPAVLYELAQTYFVMGLEERAASSLEEIRKMGELGAGDYAALAEMQLEDLGTKDVPETTDQGAFLRIGTIAQERDASIDPATGESVVLKIPIERLQPIPVDGPALNVYVYFFDLVNGARIEQSTADPPSYRWVGERIDWEEGGSEALEVVYFHPTLTPEQKRDLGERKYHGYIVKVYYQNELQDVVANPRTLFDHASDSGAEASSGNPLFDFAE